MDTAALIPTPDAIPAAWGWFQLLLLPTLFCHILFMNVLVGTAFIALVCRLTVRTAAPVTEAVAKHLPVVIAFTVNLGVAPLLFAQVLYGHLFYTSSILMAAFWLAIIPLLIIAYGLAYVYKSSTSRPGRGRIMLIAPITLALFAIAFFFTNNLTLLQNPAAWSRYFTEPRGLLLNTADPMLLPRYLHFMVSAVAVGGLALALYFHYRQRKGSPYAGAWIGFGCRWFGRATLVNLLVGGWFLAVVPRQVLTPSTPEGLGLLISLGLGLLLALASVRAAFKERPLQALHFFLPTLALMLVARSLLRSLLLAPWFSLSQLPVTPDYGPLALFLCCLLAGLVLVAWLVRFTLRSCGEVWP